MEHVRFQLGNGGTTAKNVREHGKGQENLSKAGSEYGYFAGTREYKQLLRGTRTPYKDICVLVIHNGQHSSEVSTEWIK